MRKVVDIALVLVPILALCSCQRVIFDNTPADDDFPNNISWEYGLGKIQIDHPVIIFLDGKSFVLDYEAATHLSIDSLKKYNGLLKYVYNRSDYFHPLNTRLEDHPFYYANIAFPRHKITSADLIHIQKGKTVNGLDIYEFRLKPDCFILLLLADGQIFLQRYQNEGRLKYEFPNKYILGAVPIYSNKKKRELDCDFYVETHLHKFWRYLTWRLF